ncbi:hypothetical protein CYLTODRAFT_274994 [Cylindrobasidium torrendii FP15055 ss-10]|uniref:Uncharacterized protein n=1 Tax=Cylindrobasidium torrendii FP15055 ss-10 TaxID=1314674 RepID=A0A0D7BBS0_9AGAR|nr:hypothetical protein CYLTODRAFT_274994 [Cylindrobasidium torrendii FP15055 ss-10]
MPDSVTYRKQLYPLGHGYPLWCPAPSENLPTAYRDDGMRIGDVGLLTSGGGFDYLWNVHYPHDHPINLNIDGSTRVPLEDNAPQPPLSPLNENDDRQVRVHSQHHNPHTCIASSTINARQLSADMTVDPAILGCLAGGGAAFEFSTVHDASAALVLPLGARRVDAVRLSEYQQYAAKHATSWYRFVKNELRRDMESGTLYLVTGTDKCFSWGATAVSRSGSNNALSLKFFAANIASTSVGFRNSWLQSIGASTRIGEEDTMNQCVFSRGFVISIKTHRKLLSWNSKSAEVRLEVTTDTQGGADAKKPRASGSGGPVSSIRRWFGSSGGAKEAGEDIERDDGERTSTEIDMDESNVDVFPFPSYDVPVSLIN